MSSANNMSNWQERAAQALQEGYQPGGTWERQLRRHLERFFPALVQELQAQGDWEAYLQAQTWEAKNFYADLCEQGLPPESARELAMERLFPKAPEDEDRPEPWELEGAQESALEAARKVLQGRPPA
jgi:hypothetical protein